MNHGVVKRQRTDALAHPAGTAAPAPLPTQLVPCDVLADALKYVSQRELISGTSALNKRFHAESNLLIKHFRLRKKSSDVVDAALNRFVNAVHVGVVDCELGASAAGRTQLCRILTECVSCTVMRLSKNKLATVPSEIRNMRALEALALSSNCLRDLPVEMAGLPALNKLWLDHNR